MFHSSGVIITYMRDGTLWYELKKRLEITEVRRKRNSPKQNKILKARKTVNLMGPSR